MLLTTVETSVHWSIAYSRRVQALLILCAGFEEDLLPSMIAAHEKE
jgi:hypothetical protein